MLRTLGIRDFVIVAQLELEFGDGFSVLTGETGAGKSILIEALSLALGARADASVVRVGAERAEVTAEFDLADCAAAQDWLEQHALRDEAACLLRRTVDRAGKSRAFINGTPVTVQQLKQLSELLLDIHGQHAHQSLQQAATQRELLDAFAGAAALAGTVRERYQQWQQAEKAWAEWRASAETLAAERDRLQDEVRELQALALSPTRWQTLQADHLRLANAVNLQEGTQFALDALSDSDAACAAQLMTVSNRLAELAAFDADLQASVTLLESARIQLEEAAHGLRRYALGLELDEEGLRDAETQLAQIMAASRRYRVPPEQLHERLAASEEALAQLMAHGSGEGLAQQCQAAAAQYQEAALQLSAVRTRAAAELSRTVTATMVELAMGQGRLVVTLTPLAAGTAHGLEAVSFLVAAHAAQEPAPLAKVASGGELSRISLALQAALSQVAAVPTLIFDEVDTGIGGRVAEIVGRLLENLGTRHQVLCVTHLPQVAARARHHFTVTKTEAATGVNSAIQQLDGEQRVEELARMLGGVAITPTTRRHAAEMLGR